MGTNHTEPPRYGDNGRNTISTIPFEIQKAQHPPQYGDHDPMNNKQ